MSKYLAFQFGVFCAFLCHCVSGFVPSPTNVSVVCHNFVNVLYWNYSNAAEPLRFSVLINAYLSGSETVNTSKTNLDISNYSIDGADNYIVSVTAHAGQEQSQSTSIDFTYSTDFYDEKSHKYKCSLDFPAVNTSVHKEEIEVSFWHPSVFYDQDFLREEFKYTVTYNQETQQFLCFEDEDLCTANIYLNRSMAGEYVELRFEGKIAAIPTHTSRNIRVSDVPHETVNIKLWMGLLGGGLVMTFIIIGVVGVLRKKWSKVPKVPEVLRSIIGGHSSSVLLPQNESPIVSPTASDGHKPILNEISYDFTPVLPDEKDCEITTDLANTEVDESEHPEVDEYNNDSTGFSQQRSEYDSPKFLQEVGPEDFAEGYGPRPPVI
ncbi:interferon gamma receptor 1-like [Pseudorasbora parva]|uniref:interferon gamma receptor 1-like n=1 Tax=Pseudorasbora parva TaxID=51549 RepID=UPI00351F261F